HMFDTAPMPAAVFKLVMDSGCSIIDTRIICIGAKLTALTLLLSGNWNQLAKFKACFESSFLSLEKQHKSDTLTRYSKAKQYDARAFPYFVYIVAPNLPSALNTIICFLLELKVEIHELSASAYQAPITQASMLGISVTLVVSPEQSITDFRESLLIFCDENNLEVTLEPQKH